MNKCALGAVVVAIGTMSSRLLGQSIPEARFTRIGVGVTAGLSSFGSGDKSVQQRTSRSTSGASGIVVDHMVNGRAGIRAAAQFSSRDAEVENLFVVPAVLRLRTFDVLVGGSWSIARRGSLVARLAGDVGFARVLAIDVLSADRRADQGELQARSSELSLIPGVELLMERPVSVLLSVAYRRGVTDVTRPNEFTARSLEARVVVFALKRRHGTRS
jgi:hypothetical protein